jgi:hypothetical protein
LRLDAHFLGQKAGFEAHSSAGRQSSPSRRASLRTVIRLLSCLAIQLPVVGGLAAADKISALRAEAEKRVGISVSIPSTRQLPDHQQQDVTFEPLRVVESRGGDAQAASLYLHAYIDEFSKYPRSFLRKVNVEWVAFVKGLRVDEEPRAATYLRFYAPTTMAPRGGMVYDVQQGATNQAYVRRSLHHEFFHFIDEGVQVRGIEDADWLALNPPGFKYTGKMANFSQKLDHPAPGIITAYSAKSSSEDRAELFAALMDEETYPRLREIAAADPVVRRKIRYLIGFLERIDPAMGSNYFRKRLGKFWQPLTQSP